MSLSPVNYCPGTLKPGFNTYSPAALRQLFDGKRVSHILPYEAPRRDEDTKELFLENRTRISISGVQEKLSLILDRNKLRLTKAGEQGTHILKPIPTDLKKVAEVPANEHLTMQIAAQVYGIRTAANGLIFFRDGEPAYITKRFDLRKDGLKWNKEDFASLAWKSAENAGADFKYDYDYTRLGQLIREFVLPWRVEIEKYVTQVVFNFLFSNGDAHLKNFALLETQNGDHLLSPAYDLIDTRIHVSDATFGLNGGLMPTEMRSVAYRRSGNPAYRDFIDFATGVGVASERAEKILAPFLKRQPMVEELINRSYLSDPTKKAYLLHYNSRRNLLSQ